MDEFKIESKSLNDIELKSPINEDANERISVVIPVVKCEAEVRHVITVRCVNGLMCMCVCTFLELCIWL